MSQHLATNTQVEQTKRIDYEVLENALNSQNCSQVSESMSELTKELQVSYLIASFHCAATYKVLPRLSSFSFYDFSSIT